VLANDEAVGPDGRVMEMLSEHQVRALLCRVVVLSGFLRFLLLKDGRLA
jgi:phosphoketolase